MAEFLHMNGHGSFIWLSYGVAFLALFIMGLLSFLKQRNTEHKIAQLRPSKNQRQNNSPSDQEPSGTP
ncbi:heme exporter protein CcmD [Kordiimonas sp. SCSIO 12610]|uniref:heme exporter protein CcmD n=1 Tax=Kordiimonas sp. SCSIO 12610 TaxID=2829597 RepID=UPI00210CA3C5|nr:heme exporter protein CcmD [Kordiimonas sp. SCSIO 12610]UTW55630.1 heme exporter protein CcmD [Kordiimonas sp. SCSIO 12610]